MSIPHVPTTEVDIVSIPPVETHAPPPELYEIRFFVALWFREVAGPGEYMEIRALHKGGRQPPQRFACLDADERYDHLRVATGEVGDLVVDWVTACLANGDDVYFGVLPRSRPAGKEADVGSRRLVYGDLDYGEIGHHGAATYATREDARAAIERVTVLLGVPPWLIVDSGGGLHVYWLLAVSPSIEEWLDAEARLVHALGADTDAMDLARILRFPGTTNFKIAPGRPVRAIDANEGTTVTLVRVLGLPVAPKRKPARGTPQESAYGSRRPRALRPHTMAPVIVTLEMLKEVLQDLRKSKRMPFLQQKLPLLIEGRSLAEEGHHDMTLFKMISGLVTLMPYLDADSLDACFGPAVKATATGDVTKDWVLEKIHRAQSKVQTAIQEQRDVVGRELAAALRLQPGVAFSDAVLSAAAISGASEFARMAATVGEAGVSATQWAAAVRNYRARS